jgi:hypothetical protein
MLITGVTGMATATLIEKTGKNLWDMTPEETEKAFVEVVRNSQQDLHAKGSPYIIGNNSGTYAVYADGKKILTSHSRITKRERH